MKRNRAHMAVMSKARSLGYTIIELMISIVLGLFIIGALVTLLVTNSVNSAELNKSGAQIENGRYAMQLLTESIQHAGFLGAFSPTLTTSFVLPADPCATAVSGLGFSSSPVVLPIAIYGWDGGTTPVVCTGQLANRKAGTDAVLVRHASTAEIAPASAVANEVYLQVLLCSTPPATPVFIVNNTAGSTFPLTQKDCGTPAGIRKYQVQLFYIADCNVCGSDTTPTLKVSEFLNGAFVTTPLVEGIENLQIEYGLDTNADGAPDCYTTNPESVPAPEVAACPNAAGYFAATTALKNWGNVVAARVHVLARNVDGTATWTDNRTYDLGGGVSVGPFNDHFKRHIYAATARVYNTSGWRENP